ncbi:hypothetical protein [Humisphaera borealis]|nr:hypothetical protein [Humisphaera borealis]
MPAGSRQARPSVVVVASTGHPVKSSNTTSVSSSQNAIVSFI